MLITINADTIVMNETLIWVLSLPLAQNQSENIKWKESWI